MWIDLPLNDKETNRLQLMTSDYWDFNEREDIQFLAQTLVKLNCFIERKSREERERDMGQDL